MKRGAKLIRPWSSYSSDDATQDNFPALKHFFPCEDGAGTYGLRDVVGGITYGLSKWSANDAFSVRPVHQTDGSWNGDIDGGHHNQPLSAGSWDYDPAKKTLVLVCVKANGFFSFGFGDSITQQEISFTQTAFTTALIKGATSVWLGAGSSLDANTPSMTGSYFQPGGDGIGFYTDAGGAYQAIAPVSLASISPGPTLPPIGSVGDGRYLLGLYGAAVFQFENEYPTDIQRAIEWMRAEWARGNKAIYPGWKGIR